MTLQRRAPLKRGADLKRTPMARGTKPLPQESPKRRAERPLRAAVRAQAIERDGGRCVGPERGLPGRCGWLPDRFVLEVHEFRQRSTHPGSHLQLEDTVTLCPIHHSYVTSPSGGALVIVMAAGLIERATT